MNTDNARQQDEMSAASEDVSAPNTWRGRLILGVLGLVAVVSIYFGSMLVFDHFRAKGLSMPVFGGQRIVVFDPVRFMNAQRAAASILAMRPSADLALTMTQVAKQAEAVIKEKADGALVLIKQSVVIPEGIPDITDEVLVHFGLPTAVPTVDISIEGAVEELAPTTSMFSIGKQAEDAYLERDLANIREEARQDARSAHEKVLP